MQERITLAVPFHTGLDYLRLALESVVDQRSPHWELLVCDDGGIEAGAREIAESFGDDRIRYLRNRENLGMVRNWNHCIDEVATPLVTLLHADDRLRPDYVERILDLAGRHPEATAYYCGASIIDARGRSRLSVADSVKDFFVPGQGPETTLQGESAVRALMAGNFIMCPTLCLRKERLGTRRFSEQWRQVQDLEFTSRLLMDGDTLVGTREIAYEYRRHEAGATARQSASFLRFDEEFELFDAVADRAESLGWHEAARVSRRKRIVKLHLLYRSVRHLARLDPSAAAATLRYLGRKSAGGGSAAR